jgi:AcrR family transcriptional regulator
MDDARRPDREPGPVRTPKRATAVRQEQIAAAAMALIAKHGLRGLNMAVLARQVGVVPSALYRHFRGKGQILSIILDRAAENLHANLRAARESSPDPCARLKRLLEGHLALLRKGPGMPRLVFADELGVRYPAERTKLLGILLEYLGGIEAIVREGQAAGCIRREVPASAFARLHLGLIQSAVLMGHFSGGRLDPEAGMAEAWSILERALCPDPGPSGAFPPAP